jgi:hypothetical protein
LNNYHIACTFSLPHCSFFHTPFHHVCRWSTDWWSSLYPVSPPSSFSAATAHGGKTKQKKKVLEEEAAKIETYFVRMYSNFALKWGEWGFENREGRYSHVA